MRKIYLFLGIMLVLGACSKDDIKTYKGDNYLQFVKVVTDSSVCSFLAYPNDNELEFPVNRSIKSAWIKRDQMPRLRITGYRRSSR